MSDAYEDTLAAMQASLAAFLPERYVQRSLLLDPGAEKKERLELGVICLVSGGGGGYANYSGREGELGSLSVKVVGFLKVGDKTAPVAVEQAELALRADVIAWCQQIKPEPLADVVPGNWSQSQQLEHPYGWVTMDLTVRNV